MTTSRVSQLVIERDYAQSYVLLGLSETSSLRNALVFKGGTALRKVHFGDYRFSEDLDFSMVEGPIVADLEDAVRRAVARGEEAAREIAPLGFSVVRYVEREPHPGGQETFIVRAQFPWQREPLVPVKLEVTHDEPVLLPAEHLRVRHGYEKPDEARHQVRPDG